MSQHTGSHKNSLNLLGGKYLNESHWPMHRIRLLECIQIQHHLVYLSHLIFHYVGYFLSFYLY